ncbi:MAG: methylated-DNA--[protein]-cysteine S-methyltransferase [Gammaproteobacteria bacterium]|nr:MAG: methylated-DNA--[protein]-cysteine S-methyltransferase [Gammaproteobacteria bacterium]
MLRYEGGSLSALEIVPGLPEHADLHDHPVPGGLSQVEEGTTTCHHLHEQVVSWLDAYFEGGPLPELPRLSPPVSAFQARLRRALLAIPPGQTRTYGDLARQLGSSPRAVGQACRANPVPILVPCHRVVSARGDGGYMGQEHSPLKGWFLEHERGR